MHIYIIEGLNSHVLLSVNICIKCNCILSETKSKKTFRKTETLHTIPALGEN